MIIRIITFNHYSSVFIENFSSQNKPIKSLYFNALYSFEEESIALLVFSFFLLYFNRLHVDNYLNLFVIYQYKIYNYHYKLMLIQKE